MTPHHFTCCDRHRLSVRAICIHCPTSPAERGRWRVVMLNPQFEPVCLHAGHFWRELGHLTIAEHQNTCRHFSRSWATAQHHNAQSEWRTLHKLMDQDSSATPCTYSSTECCILISHALKVTEPTSSTQNWSSHQRGTAFTICMLLHTHTNLHLNSSTNHHISAKTMRH